MAVTGMYTEVLLPSDPGRPWQESQYELGGVRFGGFRSDVIVTKADHGAADVRTQDVPNPVGPGLLMGRDRLTGPVYAFDLVTNRDNGPHALETAAALAKAWRAGIDTVPGVVFPLRYFTGGRLRRAYGRPRRFAGPGPDLMTRSGAAKITADFQCADELHYDDVEQSLTLTVVGTAAGGGYVLPAVLPTLTAPGAQRQGVVTVGGDAPAPFEVTVHGPVSAPWVSGPGWRLDFPTLSLAYDRAVTVSTYPWALTVLRDDGADLSGSLALTSRLLSARLRPGAATITFGGVDPTNTATATVRWRPAWWSL